VKIGITQRVEIVASYGERRDCLDQQWSELVTEMGFIPVPLPNLTKEKVPQLMESLALDAVILSGGNSLSYLSPDARDAAPERDSFELALIEYMLANDKPIIGVCRGMQMLNYFYGGKLVPITGHVAQKHCIVSENPLQYDLPTTVNSYHNYGISAESLAEPLTAIAHDDSGNIEAFIAKGSKVLGIMWHPERETPFIDKDINLIRRFVI